MHNSPSAIGGAIRAATAVVCAFTVIAGTTACNRRVFKPVEQSCDSTIPVDIDIPLQKAADILIVVDNSGSMQEEQNRLKQNFFNLKFAADPNNPDVANDECPLSNLAEIPERYKNPPKSLYEGDGPLSRCGFIQLLAAFDNDFRVGVITTDVGLYDNRALQSEICVPNANGDGGGHCAGDDSACAPNTPNQCVTNTWGFHPQKGCLQPDGDPALLGTPGANVHKLMKRDDLANASTSDLATRFASTLDNIKTFGSPYERGLDAVATFLDDGADRAAGCEGDLADFRRPDAQLVVMMLSDEEDCSHALGGGGSFDELDGESTAQAPWDGLGGTLGNDANGDAIPKSARCYIDEAELPSPGLYADAIKRVDAHAKVVAITGLLPDDSAVGGFDAGGCRADNAAVAGVAGDCIPTQGQSNRFDLCDANGDHHPHGDPNTIDGKCCVADGNERYLDVAKSFVTGNNEDFLLDSICRDSFRTTMIKVAAFIGASDFVDLVEAPKDGEVVVTLKRPSDAAAATVEQVDEASCASTTGWYLEGDKRVVFCGDAIPGPGDELRIRAKGQAATAACQAVEP